MAPPRQVPLPTEQVAGGFAGYLVASDCCESGWCISPA